MNAGVADKVNACRILSKTNEFPDCYKTVVILVYTSKIYTINLYYLKIVDYINCDNKACNLLTKDLFRVV